LVYNVWEGPDNVPVAAMAIAYRPPWNDEERID
jgi:hypothetical protein